MDEEHPKRSLDHLKSAKVLIAVSAMLTGIIFAIIMMNVKESRIIQREYFIIAEDLKKMGEEALKERAYVRSRRYLDRALQFAEKSSDIFHRNPLEREIKAIIAGNEGLQKAGQGYVLLGERWVKREEFMDLYNKGQLAKKGLRENLTKAVIAFAGENYEEAVKYYQQVLNGLNEAAVFGFHEFDREKIEQDYQKALLLRSKTKADDFYQRGEFKLAVMEYEKMLNIVDEMKEKDLAFAEDVQKTAVEVLLLSAETWLKLDNFRPQNFRDLIKQARSMLHSHPYLSPQTVSSLEDRIRTMTKKMEILRAKKVHELAQNFVKLRNVRSMDDANNEISALIYGHANTESNGSSVNNSGTHGQSENKGLDDEPPSDTGASRYKRARSLLRGFIGMLQKSEFANDADVHVVIMDLQRDIDNLNKAEEAERAERAQLWERVASGMKLAKAKEEAGKYDDALMIYKDLHNTVTHSKSRNETRFASVLEGISAHCERLNVKKKEAELREMLASAEEKIASGKLAEVIILAQSVPTDDGDSGRKNASGAEPLIRRLAWLGALAKGMRSNFALAVEQEALQFFQKRGIKKVSVRQDETSIQHCSLLGDNPRERCLTFNLKGQTVVYAEAGRSMAAYPVICDLRLRFCEGEIPFQNRELECRELKVKSSLGPEPFSFGQLK